jgi:hypothetical protein
MFVRKSKNTVTTKLRAKVKDYNQWAGRDVSGRVQAQSVDSLLQYNQQANGELLEPGPGTGLQVSEFAKTEIVRLTDLGFRAAEEQTLTR